MQGVQEKWSSNHQKTVERLLTAAAEKMHKEYAAEQERVTVQLSLEVKRQMENIKAELENHYQSFYTNETSKLSEKHQLEIAETKKKQWCWLCEAEAIYFCCWNTNYCSTECQQKHWPTHKPNCRRKTDNTSKA